jgi:hypothetical protein
MLGLKQIASMGTPPVVKLTLKKLGKKSSIIPGFLNRLICFVAKLSPRKLFLRITGGVIKLGLVKKN